MDQPRKLIPEIIIPGDEEDAAITAAALADPDAQPLTDEQLSRMRPTADFPELVAILKANGKWGRPPLPPEDRKQRVTLHLDPDLLAALKAGGRGWQTRANAALRAALGLPPRG